MPGDDHAMDLGRPVVDAEGADVTVEAFEDKVAGDPASAADLHRPVDAAADRLGDDEEKRGALFDGDARVGDGGDDGEGGAGGSAGEPLVAVDDPGFSVFLGAAAEHGGIGAGAGGGLGHGEAGAAFAARERVEVP